MNTSLIALVDEATAAAKRDGHGTVEFVHLWSALAQVDEPTFQRFGPLTPPLEEQLGALPKTWETPSLAESVVLLVDTMESEGENLDRIASALAERVHAEEISAPAPARASTPDAATETNAAPTRVTEIDPRALRDALKASLLGQDHAIEIVVRRLALTRRSFDLRPERPDGVFFFAGPTGVGKTYLAELLSEELYGADSLIRLDMSEYSDPAAVSRLVGPQPGYVGYDRPESWLTTKMIAAGSAVILLDEVEKSHPIVWNVFLQLFDSGRLTDAQGKTADFSSAVVILTSNLGSSELAGRKSLGFSGSAPSNDGAASAVRSEIERIVPMELVNRLDDIVVFNVLDQDMIEGVARQVLDDAFNRVKGTYEVEISADLVAGVVNTLHDARFGARHVHRIIEERVLGPLVMEPPGSYRAEFDGTTCRWIAASR